MAHELLYRGRMASVQNKLRLSTSAKGTVVAKKALVSMAASKKTYKARVNKLETALASNKAVLKDEKVKTAKLTKEARVLKVVARKGITLAETAYGGREGRRLIYGKLGAGLHQSICLLMTR